MFIRHRFVSSMVALAAAACLPALAAAPAADKGAPVQFQWGEKIPMRDGVKLNATVYRPLSQKDPLPCVFTLTPYIAQSYHDRGMYFAAHGYVFLGVDVRGRGNSEGEFTPMLQEARDGHDIVEWLAAQPYCNGKVSMWGGSYAGYDQWATAKELPPHLATIVPAAAAKPGIDFPMSHNMAYPYDMQWLTFVSGRAGQEAIFGDDKFWSGIFRRLQEEGAPFAELDRHVGNPSPIFQTWIAHPMQDAYWDSYNPTPEQYAKLDVPILTITGDYDGDQPGALAFYREHMQYGSAAAKAKHYLIIGPWDHPGTRTPKADVAGLTFGPASLLDMNALHKAWYDWTMKSGGRPKFLKDKVAFYVVGEEAWRYAPSLDAVTANNQTWYLDSTDGRANDVFGSGRLLADKTHGGKPDRYTYDPRLIPPETEDDDKAPGGLVDQRDVLAPTNGQLVYHTPPFAADTDVAGFFRLSAWIALDQPDTDIGVSVYEIKSDGGSVALTSDALRARYRQSLREAHPVEPGAVERYDFSRFTFAARRIAKGSRLRLVLAPLDGTSTQKNYNSGGDVSRETRKDARKVTVTLYHDAQHPSALSVPLAAKSSVAPIPKSSAPANER